MIFDPVTYFLLWLIIVCIVVLIVLIGWNLIITMVEYCVEVILETFF